MKVLTETAFAAVLLALAGCAWVPQKVTIAPQVQVPTSNIGNGAPVVVKVVDTRASQRIGYRGMDSKLAEITTEQELVPIFQQKIIDGLTRQGFKATPAGDSAARVLKVEIRAINYSTDMDFWKGTVRAKAALNAHCKSDDFIYDQLYVAERKEPAVEAPGAKTNQRLINGAISDVLQRLLEDAKLAKALAN